MPIELVTPVGRFVQGSITLEVKNDPTTNKPKLAEDGSPIKECFIAIAIRKDDPQVGAFFQAITTQARAEFPHLFDAAGNCTHPKFAWKIQDGDGVDQNGKSVKDKPGFAGHWVFKTNTRFLPKCYHYGKYDPAQMIQNPEEVIKRGYYVRLGLRISGNGVTPQDRTQVPGMFLSPNLVELVAFGEVIVGGPDAQETFGKAAPITALPPGASAAPIVGAPTPASGGLPGLAPPPMPGGTPALPALHPAMPAATGMPAIGGPAAGPPVAHRPQLAPPPPAGPVFVMQPSAMGATREQLHAQGWTDDLLIQHGHMMRVG
jgi:hypothetical protein